MRFPEFLETIPPNETRDIESLFVKEDSFSSYKINHTKVNLYCNNSQCRGNRIFDLSVPSYYQPDKIFFDETLTYVCQNCGVSFRYFSLRLRMPSGPLIKEDAKYL